MKKIIALMLVFILAIGLLAGCRRTETPQDMVTQASEAMGDMIPKGHNGQATDGDGFIGHGMLPNN